MTGNQRTLDWNAQLVDQLEVLWDTQLRSRLDGLTDTEYFWEPVVGCWSIRRRGESTVQKAVGAGEFTFEFASPAPDPPPVTTIAWRLAHVIVGVFGARNAAHFSGPPADYRTWEYGATAASALDQLDEGYAGWIKGVRGLGTEDLAKPCGPAEPFPEASMAALVLHISREVIHHGAEICLLRDLYRWQGTADGRQLGG
jgi:hypothetical protein